MTTDRSDNAIAGDRLRGLTADVTPKTRLCLKCRSSFESEGAGERVCRKCKSSSAWRSGR
jgi:tRNA(Ile2) C34 agmatinyltransferase TiaS